MARIASLGMYEFPSTTPALDAVWIDLAARLCAAGVRDVPKTLTRDRPHEEIWRDPNLLLGQTCGYPLRKFLAKDVRVVATPVYAVPGCAGAFHRSFIIVARESPYDDLASLRGSRAAVNGRDSNTGMNLFRATIAPLANRQPFFRSVAITGAHAASVLAVATGSADVAAIDCVSFWLIARERPDLTEKVRILASTPASPGLPLITSSRSSAEEVASLRHALADAARAPSIFSEAWARVGITGFSVLGDEAYDIVSTYEHDAEAMGYPLLA